MKKNCTIILLLSLYVLAGAQTVVKMSVPEQASEPLQVVVLFDELVPEGMPVVLGLMGYSVVGGIEPYSYQWVQNEVVIGTGDVVVITPKKGDQFYLKATDKNKCYSTTAFNLKVGSRNDEQEKSDNGFKIFPTIIKDNQINIEIPNFEIPTEVNVRIFGVSGNLLYQRYTYESFVVNHNLVNGIYFVSVRTDKLQKVAKVIVEQ
jgi:hypothetical protein